MLLTLNILSSGIWHHVAPVRRADFSEEHTAFIFKVTRDSSQLATSVCLTTDGEESLLQRHLHIRVYLLPRKYSTHEVLSLLFWRH
jgi:hypothetical protein